MLAQTLATGDKFRTEDLHSLPAGTMVKSLGNSGWWEVTELPQVETVSERDQLALKLRDLLFPHPTSGNRAPQSFYRQADYVLANFTPAGTAVAEVSPAVWFDYPERIRDCDGDLWKLVGPGSYSLVNDLLPGGVHTTNVSLAELLVNYGPISAE